MAKHYGQKRGWPIDVRSGGIMGLIDRQADPLAIKVMGEIGIDIAPHKSGGITDELAEWADHILVMELRHQMELHRRHPAAEGKVLMLGSFGGMPKSIRRTLGSAFGRMLNRASGALRIEVEFWPAPWDSNQLCKPI